MVQIYTYRFKKIFVTAFQKPVVFSLFNYLILSNSMLFKKMQICHLFKNLLLLLIPFFSMTTCILHAQSFKSECLELIRELYKKLNTPDSTFKQNRIYYLDYQITTIFRKPVPYPQHTTNVKVYVHPSQIRFLSQEASIYQDAANSFTIMPDRKVIYWGNSTLNFGKELRQKHFAMLQDTLFDIAQVQECEDIQLPNGKANKQVALALNGAPSKLFPYVRLTFQIDAAKQFIHKVIIDYPPPNKIARVEITFNEINYDYKTDILKKPVMSIFFNEKQELLPEYRSYKLVDHRKKSKQ